MSGLYVHVPFCTRACPYCDFDFEVRRAPETSPLVAALQRECDAREDELGGLAPTTVYFGGGTPSALGAVGVASLCRWLARRFDLRAVTEWTVECNPEHVDPAFVAACIDAGVTRVSLGVQSFEAAGLSTLGRGHDTAQARAAMAAVAQAGVRSSVDLIVGWPGQTPAQLEADLRTVIDGGVDHVSVYALTIEAGTPWPALVRRGLRRDPDPDHQANRLLQAETVLTDAGFSHYEISSYAREGRRSAHNEGYWSWRDYVGLGPSAHSARYDAAGSVVRRANPRGYAVWSADPAAGVAERLTGPAAASEALWLGLRRLAGIDVPRFVARFPSVDRAWVEGRIAPQLRRGNVQWDGDRLRVAPTRWLWHDGIAADVLG